MTFIFMRHVENDRASSYEELRLFAIDINRDFVHKR